MNTIEVQVRGLTFTGLSGGPDDGPLLLLLHGMSRTSWEWHHQIPALAALGYRTVAPDLRGRCPSARPMAVEAYVIDEFMADALAIADSLAGDDQPFHLMGTSIGSMVAWHLAAEHPGRIKSLACINIPHPSAFIDVAGSSGAEEQQQRMSYTNDSRMAGNERTAFEATLDRMALPASETDPYRIAFASDDAITAAYHWYRAAAIDPRNRSRLGPVTMPTLFIWPPGAGNVSRDTAEANAHHVTGPYRFEILDNAKNYALQGEPERVSRLLCRHLEKYGEGWAVKQ